MNMNQEGLGDYQMRNEITAFEADRDIARAPSTYPVGSMKHLIGELDPSGHTYGWELEPTSDGATVVTHTYDWNGVQDKEALGLHPRVSEEQMRGSIANLGRAVSCSGPSPDQPFHQVLQGGGGIGRETGVHRPRLHHGAARRGEPAEAPAPVLLPRRPGEARGRRRALAAEGHGRGEGPTDRHGVGGRVERPEAGVVEHGAGAQVVERPAVHQHPGVDHLSTLDLRHHPEHGVLERVALALRHRSAPKLALRHRSARKLAHWCTLLVSEPDA